MRTITIGTTLLVGALLALALSVVPANAQDLPVVAANPFEDLPKDHPSYDAVQKLIDSGIMEGFPDGTFKGGRVITRYDLALAVARAHLKIDELKAQGVPVSPEEQKLIDLLDATVGRELKLLGIRTDSLERRIQSHEDRTNLIEARKSNVSISGFYRLDDAFVYKPVSYQDYPFTADLDPFYVLRDRGLTPLRQEAFLRFAGRPVFDGIPSDNIEAFAELRGLIVGNAGLHLTFNFSPDPARIPTQAGDWADDFSTGLRDESRIQFNRAHFSVRAKNLTFRAFSNESAADLTDPNVLFTVDTLAPFSGVEASGAVRKFGYSSSVLKTIELVQPSGLNPRNITQFDQESSIANDLAQVDAEPKQTRKSDIYTLRLSYEPYKFDKGNADKRLVFGGTYVEHAFRYTIPNDFIRTMAADVQYTLTRNGKFDTVATMLWNQARRDLWDRGFKLDSTYLKKGFMANLKYYTFGSEYRTDVAQNPFVDTDVSFNFKRQVTKGLPTIIEGLPDPSNRGESCFRLQLRNDWQGEGLKAIKNLILLSTWEIKSWHRDPDNPLMNDDESASRFYVQALADVTRRWHLELYSEVLKDLRIDSKVVNVKDSTEIGTLTNTFRSDWRALDSLSLLVELQVKDDMDSLDTDNRHFKMVRQKYELPWQPHKRLFLKPTFERIQSSDIQYLGVPVTPVNERNIGRAIIETNWVVFPKWSLKNLWVVQKTKNARLLAPASNGPIRVEDNNTNIIVTESLWNLTPALKLRYVYSYQDTNLYNTNVDPLFLTDLNVSNNFAELLYTPSTGTEVRLTYGTEYENPLDPFDNGPVKFWRTEKIIQLRAQTDF